MNAATDNFTWKYLNIKLRGISRIKYKSELDLNYGTLLSDPSCALENKL
jgi:hypothetical protein